MPAIDFERLFEISPNAYMVLDRDLCYVAANAVYLRETGSTLEQLLGKNIFELFPNDPDDASNVPRQMLRASFERVLASGKSDHLALIPYRVPKEIDGKLVDEERFWSATHSPVLDASGKVSLILQHTVDVTELHRRERSARGDMIAETGILSRANAVQSENARLDSERKRLHALFEQAPGFMAFLDGPDFVFALVNASYQTLVGRKSEELLGKPVREALPEVVEQGFIELLQTVYRTKEPFVGTDVALMLKRRPGGSAEEAFVDFVYQPVRDAAGHVQGIFVQGHDVTGRKLAEQEREAARRAAEAFSEELVVQSREVRAALEAATTRINELEARAGGG